LQGFSIGHSMLNKENGTFIKSFKHVFDQKNTKKGEFDRSDKPIEKFRPNR